uniref:Uncharacterized protein n=1 Tax=Rhizophora mucronata TaxID=61149 RepID=A0A2P2INK8_RHIMU
MREEPPTLIQYRFDNEKSLNTTLV